MVIFVLSNGRN